MNMIASAWQLRASYIRWALLLVPLTIFVGMLSGQLAGSGADSAWFDALDKPALYPPPALFGLAWTILYALMGFSLALIFAAKGAPGRKLATIVFLIQLALNLAWSPIFFAEHEISWALTLILVLDFAVFITILLFWRVRPMAGILLLPYLAWLLFATVLNWQFLILNEDLDGQSVSGPVQRFEF